MRQFDFPRIRRAAKSTRVLTVAVVIVTVVGAWLLMRGRSRDVQEHAWDAVRFPEMTGSSRLPDLTRRNREAWPAPAHAADGAAHPVGGTTLHFKTAANVPLDLAGREQPTPVQQVRFDELRLPSEPTWLEGEIEVLGAAESE